MGMGENKFAKSVSFNTKNEDDKKILQYIKRRNFSGFAKKAMLEYIDRRNEEKSKKEEPKKVSKLEELKKRTEKPSSPQVFSPSQKIDK